MVNSLDATDRRIVTVLQDGFPICPQPFAVAAASIGLEEGELLSRLIRLRQEGVLSRFGPLYKAEAIGGAVTLAAMAVPAERFDEVAEMVNAFEAVAHNYAREHALNMWFVVAAESQAVIDDTLKQIAARTGLEVLNFPKEREYFLELKLEVLP